MEKALENKTRVIAELEDSISKKKGSKKVECVNCLKKDAEL